MTAFSSSAFSVRGFSPTAFDFGLSGDPPTLGVITASVAAVLLAAKVRPRCTLSSTIEKTTALLAEVKACARCTLSSTIEKTTALLAEVKACD